MNRSKYLVGTVGSAIFLSLPAISQGIELAGEKLELYGKAHMSLDFSDPDASGEESQASVSNNSTRIGFKGKHDIDTGPTLLWQYEQGVDIADGGGEFASRNSFLGLKGTLGEVRVGHHDTPSKKLGSRWGMFSDTVGDRRAILGAYSGARGEYGNVLNDRADNALLYINQFDALELQAMYSASNPTESTSGGLDDNDFDLASASLTYNTEQLMIGAAAERWSLDPVNGAEEVDNLRLAASYTMNSFKAGAIYESTDSDDSVFERDAYGLNAAYRFTEATDLRLQYMVADDNEDQSASGASQLAVGLHNQLDKATQIYAAFSTTDNDANAVYQGIDGGHGDELETEPGGSPSSFSVGAVYTF
ncbi:porin [Thiohalomonas denitrificans]|uniref:Outer membrane protein (Porin) n=1 Tax=Thiohalomonas denitrificans TaxID=415747 RepID=A0A1G5PSV5_9GAMM|nr:porin [Thiohalomonas denitrificans]SCZ52685.1 Outer membrane protein (porin) [Thiohalomonas denitrificans]